LELAGLYIYAYLVGSFPTAYIVARLVKGIDIRRYGSGSVGGSNLFQQTGWWGAIPLGVFEVFVKGASHIWIGLYVLDLERDSLALIVAPLLAAIGHNWSVFLKFTGGRGVVVTLGALLALPALPPWILFASLAIALGGWAATRSSAPAVLAAFLLLPIWSWLLHDSEALMVYSGCIIAVVIAKRLVANWERPAPHLSKRRVFMNRLLRDRDTDERSDWVSRGPSDNQPSGAN
jgi:glycerol-3-phosphate acyltransferase PlsY